MTDFKLPGTLSQATWRSRTSAKTASSRSSLQSERTKALAEAAAAKEQAEQDMLMAEKENARKRHLQEMLQRATAQAHHEHDMAILKARKLEVVAKAKLDAIDYSIEQERHVFPLTTRRSSASSQRTQERGSELTGSS